LITTANVIAAESKFEGELEPFMTEPMFEMQQVFKGERYPNVVVALDGTVLATWGNNGVKVRRSEDAEGKPGARKSRSPSRAGMVAE